MFQKVDGWRRQSNIMGPRLKGWPLEDVEGEWACLLLNPSRRHDGRIERFNLDSGFWILEYYCILLCSLKGICMADSVVRE